MSEINFACSLANPNVRSVLLDYVGDVEWKSEMAKTMVDYFINISPGLFPSIAEMRSFASNKFVDEEVAKIIGIAKDFIVLPKENVDNIIRDFEEFYYNKKLTTILHEGNNNSKNIINNIRELREVKSNAIPVYTVGDLDSDVVMQEELGDAHTIPSGLDLIKRATPWGGYLKGQVCMYVAAPGNGKSLLMANEVVEMLRHDVQVYWIALGDMMRFDFITRFSSLITKVPFYDVNMNPKKYFTDEVKRLTKNLRASVVTAGAMNVNTLVDYLKVHVEPVKSMDVFVLDYDANLAAVSESMYAEGDSTYNALSAIARPMTGSYKLCMVASQPKIAFWPNEELNKDAAAESSRKQAIVDLMITMGRNQNIRSDHAGIIKAAKVRRGREGEKSHYIISNCGQIEEIDRSKYSMLMSYEG